MIDSAPAVLLMIQDYDWMPQLEGRLRQSGIRVDRVDSIRELEERWTRESPDWIVVGADVSGVVAAHLAPPASNRNSDSSILVVSENFQQDQGETQRKLGHLSPSVRIVSPEMVFGEISGSLQGKLLKGVPSGRYPATILCVDDDPLYLRGLTRRLTRYGYRVHASPSSTQALEAAVLLRPTLAIVDIRMPGMDGLELTERFSEMSTGPLPVVLLTGLDSEQTALEGFRRGARYLLRKSCNPGKVLDVVDYFVGDLNEREREALKERL
jgi:DNA-binding response OmpR family regulator